MYNIKTISAADKDSLALAVKAYLDGPHPSTGWTLVAVSFASETVAFVVSKG